MSIVEDTLNENLGPLPGTTCIAIRLCCLLHFGVWGEQFKSHDHEIMTLIKPLQLRATYIGILHRSLLPFHT